MTQQIHDLQLTDEWDKTFPLSETVNHSKVTFTTTFGIELAADLYSPKDAATPLPALAISGPFGAVKEQSSGFYAQTLAEQGFITLAFDPSFTGESGGVARRVAAPDINTDDFLSAVDYLSNHKDVDSERIGLVGICGWGGIALNAAAADPRVKATVSSTMYDMTRVAGNGYYDAQDSAADRNAARRSLTQLRTAEFDQVPSQAGGVPDQVPTDAPEFLKGYHAYYKTERGFHPRSGNSTDGWTSIGQSAYSYGRFLDYIEEIENAVLILHGSEAHSLYFGRDAYARLEKGVNPANKQLVIVEGANHTDLYDGGSTDAIPFGDLATFFTTNL